MMALVFGRRLRLFPEHGLDSREHDARAERLCDVVVRTELEAGDDIGLFPARRQHDDGYVRRARIALERVADLEPVHAGEHEVEEHEVGEL